MFIVEKDSRKKSTIGDTVWELEFGAETAISAHDTVLEYARRIGATVKEIAVSRTGGSITLTKEGVDLKFRIQRVRKGDDWLNQWS